MSEPTPYAKLDQPAVCALLFHPRVVPRQAPPAGASDLEVAVAPGIRVTVRCHAAAPAAPAILFFHGNGEIVTDYDEIGRAFVAQGVSFLVADYRGYGWSEGEPSAGSMLADSHAILAAVQGWRAATGGSAPLVVMGRSLGSACAIELAAAQPAAVAGLVIESGFATTLPLLQALGLDTARLGIAEPDGFGNLQKISGVSRPTLIIHAQHDQLIPLGNAEMLQVQSPARGKEFQVVPGADHNTILARAGERYFEVIARFCLRLAGRRGRRAPAGPPVTRQG
ncbi:MAG: alpha/beta hydrolase [Thermodesulfobacteriota bacterium]